MAASFCTLPGVRPETSCAAAAGSDFESTKEALDNRRSRHSPGGCSRAQSTTVPHSRSHHCMVRHSSKPLSSSSSVPWASASVTAWRGSFSASAKQTVERALRRAEGSSSDETQLSAASASRMAHAESRSRTRLSRSLLSPSVKAWANARAGSSDRTLGVAGMRASAAAACFAASRSGDPSIQTNARTVARQRPPAATSCGRVRLKASRTQAEERRNRVGFFIRVFDGIFEPWI